MINVVGTMFFRNRKLLLDKPRRRPTHQMIGGRIEDGETPLEAAIREAHEELGEHAKFDPNLFKPIMDFDEIAASDPKLKIHFYLFNYEGNLEGTLTTSDEIESFLWYDTTCGQDILSHTLKNEVIPYCIKNNLID